MYTRSTLTFSVGGKKPTPTYIQEKVKKTIARLCTINFNRICIAYVTRIINYESIDILFIHIGYVSNAVGWNIQI